jgi:hypothetical protein
MNEGVVNREKGASPMSIATSLAMESLCGFGEFENDKPFLNKTDALWINVRTLFRNVFSSLDSYVKKTVSLDDLVYAVLEDISVLNTVLEYQSKNRLKPTFYLCEYKGLSREFPNAVIKQPKTELQIYERSMEDSFVKAFKKTEFFNDEDVKIFDVQIKGSGGNVVLLTHLPIDLLWRTNFRKVHLLESHTGAIKVKPTWYTKLTGGKNNFRIPFNRMTLQVFGDGNNLFTAMSRKIKNNLLELAKERKWSSVTSTEKIRSDLEKLKDKPLGKWLKTLF